jgi:hypothetical protein
MAMTGRWSRARLLVGLALAVLALAGCGDEPLPVATPISDIPELRLGMSMLEAKKALGDRFSLFPHDPHRGGGASCRTFQVGEAPLNGRAISGEVVVLSYWTSSRRRSLSLLGLRPGDPRERAVELFGRPERITRSEAGGSDEIYWRVSEEDQRRVYLRASIVGDEPGGRDLIGGVEVGLEPAIYAIEGCA